MQPYALTDPDSGSTQYSRKVDDFLFCFYDVREACDGPFVGSFVAVHAVVDLRDYTLDQLCKFCECYDRSLDQLVADYGLRGGLRVLAEYVFEQFDFEDMEFCIEHATFDKAAAFVESLVQKFNQEV